MINLATGKHMTRGGFLRGGIASIIAAKSAPYVALGAASLAGSANATVSGAAMGMMRNKGAQLSTTFGGIDMTDKKLAEDLIKLINGTITDIDWDF